MSLEMFEIGAFAREITPGCGNERHRQSTAGSFSQGPESGWTSQSLLLSIFFVWKHLLLKTLM
jgi:hypothetical protein